MDIRDGGIKVKKLSLNDNIKVKLTPLGADIFYHQFDEVIEEMKIACEKPIEPHMPKIDNDGFTKFRLWYFIELYGKYIGLDSPDVISDTYFYISEDDLKEVKTE